MLQITCSVVILWVLYFFGIFAQKEAQTWFDLHETRHTILFGTYFCVEVVFMDIFFFGTFAHKVYQTWNILHETWHTTIFGRYYYV